MAVASFLYAPTKAHISGRVLPASGKGLIIFLLAIQATFCWMARARSMGGEVDLRAFYAAGVTVRDGNAHRLYDADLETSTQQRLFANKGRTLPFLYPAFAVVPFAGLSLLPYRLAFLAFLFGNLICVFFSARLLVPPLSESGISRGWLFLLFLGFFPMSIALMQGQISCVLLLIFAGSYKLAQDGRLFLSGLCLSLALVKFQIVVPVALIYLAGRQFRLLYGFCSGAGVLAGASLLLTGTAGTRAYFERLHGVSSTMLTDHAAAQVRYGMLPTGEPNLHGLIAWLAGPTTVALVLTAACSVGVILLALRADPAISALPAGLLVSYHLQPYELILVLLPITILFLKQRGAYEKHPLHLLLAGSSGAMLSIPIAPYLLAKGLTAWMALPLVGLLCASLASRSRNKASPGCLLPGLQSLRCNQE